MPLNKQTEESTRKTNGLAPDADFMTKARKVTSRISPELQGYLALAVGTFLVLFSLGYFAFFKLAIGFIGLALIAWGAYASELISTVSSWIAQLTKRS